SLPRLHGRTAARDRESRYREPLPADVGRHLRGAAGGGRLRPPARFHSRPSVKALPLSKHRAWQFIADGVLIGAAWWLTFFLLFDQSVPRYYQHLLSWRVITVVIALKLATFVVFGFYNRWWRYVSTRDMWGAARGVTAACVITDLVLYAF